MTLQSRVLIFAQKAIQSKKYDLIILDEMNMANYFGLIETEDLINLIKKLRQR